MVNDRDDFVGNRSHGPTSAQKIERIVRIETALQIEGKMEVQQRAGGNGQVAVAFFFERQVPGVIRGHSGGAADMMGVVPVDLGLEKSVGVLIVGDFFRKPRG
jgi:hypothetical protein